MELLEAGVHFGHKKERSHPKMKEYTFTIREGIFIIDLEKTRDLLKEATEFLKKEVAAGKTVLMVGTKRQAKDAVQKVAEASGMPYVTHRWLGGTLTNFETVRKSIRELESLEAKVKSPEFSSYTKKEQKVINDRIEKLQGVFGGVREMKNLPDVVFVVDAHREKLAVEEASRMGIKVVGVCDTDANPQNIDFVIPANEDAPKSIDLVMAEISAVMGVKKAKKAEEPLETTQDKEEKKTEKLEETKESKDKKVKNSSTKSGVKEKK